MKITATAIKGRDLKPGDLFSMYGPAYWAGGYDPRSIGQSVYIRTEAPANSAGHPDREVFRIEVER